VRKAPSAEELACDLAGAPRALGLVEWGFVLGAMWRVELGLFERLGRCSVGAPVPAAVAGWAMGASFAAAWRAEQLASLLPVSVGLPGRAEVTSAAAGSVAGALDGLAEIADAELPLETASYWYPALASAYELRAAHLSPAGDGPHGVVLERLVGDVRGASVRVDHLLSARAGGRRGRLTPPLH
jgi:hypothetical protein